MADHTDDVRDYVNAVFTERQRAVDAALEQTQRALDAALQSRQRDLDATFEQRDRIEQERLATQQAKIDALHDRVNMTALERTRLLGQIATESDAHIQALKDWTLAMFSEKERAKEVASDEREKSASALRDGLSRSIAEGDDRLREHIHNQFEQIRSSLISSELLEVERIDLVKTEITNLDSKVAGLFEEKQKALDSALIAQKEAVAKAEIATDRIAARGQIDQEALRADMQERLAAVRRELEQATAAQKEAVLKAEVATEKRFAGQNEWRAQSADRERSSAEALGKLTSTYMPREVAEAQNKDVRDQIGRIQDQIARMAGNRQGLIEERSESRAEVQASQAKSGLGLQNGMLAAQIRSLHLYIVGLGLSAGGLLVAALATHGFTG